MKQRFVCHACLAHVDLGDQKRAPRQQCNSFGYGGIYHEVYYVWHIIGIDASNPTHGIRHHFEELMQLGVEWGGGSTCLRYGFGDEERTKKKVL